MKLPRYSPWWGFPLIGAAFAADLIFGLNAWLFGPVMIGTLLYAVYVK